MSEGADHTFSSVARQLALWLAFFSAPVTLYATPPRVVVFIVIDQFLPDYLDASHPYTGGFKKLRDESAWYTAAHYRQIPTETAPGHATLLTGFPPAQTGIVGNDWYDRKTHTKIYSTQPGVLLVPTLGDRLKEKDPRSIVIALSGKERASRMMGGKKADRMDWYSLKSDRTVSAAAQQAMVDLGVGQDAVPDLVAVGFSTTDRIGHDYGPNSVAMKKNLTQLDQTIGEFLLFCEKRFGREGFMAVLTSDHGGLPMPESDAGKRLGARRLDRNKLRGEIETALERAFPGQKNLLLAMMLPDLYLDRTKITLEKARDALKNISGIARIYAPPFSENDEFTDMYRRSYFADRSGDLLVRLEKGILPLFPRQGTGHGSPYDYDTHVPVLFWGTSIKAAHYGREVSTLDIAPTVAAFLELPWGESSEGKPLEEVLPK